MRSRITALTIALCSTQLGISRVSADPPCLAPAEWFVNNRTPGVPLTFTPSKKECDFYQWAWQSFLFVTQSENKQGGVPRFFTYKTPNDLFQNPAGGATQVLVSPGPADNKKGLLSLTVRTSIGGKSGDVAAMAFQQAGQHGVVVDRNGRALYYGIHLNDSFVHFLTGELKLTAPNMIAQVPLTKEFPPGCLELKSAWRIVAKNESDEFKSKFFITNAVMPTLVQDASGKIIAESAPSREEQVALVALHVVGTVVGHPEFIWASFEHRDNSPVVTNQQLAKDQPVDDTRCYTFYRQATKLGDCNKNSVDTTVNPLSFVSQADQTLQPIIDVCRLFNSADNFEEEDEDIVNLNKSVQEQLGGSLSVWRNYKLIGAVWLDDPKSSFVEDLPSPGFRSADMAGEKKLSNSVMESFTQDKQLTCFSCHHTVAEQKGNKVLPGLRIKVSHVIRNAFLGPDN